MTTLTGMQVYLEADRPMDAVMAAQRSVDVMLALVPKKPHPALEKSYACLAAAKKAVSVITGDISTRKCTCAF
jgi:hypothetical protein